MPEVSEILFFRKHLGKRHLGFFAIKNDPQDSKKNVGYGTGQRRAGNSHNRDQKKTHRNIRNQRNPTRIHTVARFVAGSQIAGQDTRSPQGGNPRQ